VGLEWRRRIQFSGEGKENPKGDATTWAPPSIALNLAINQQSQVLLLTIVNLSPFRMPRPISQKQAVSPGFKIITHSFPRFIGLMPLRVPAELGADA
jgi:hypothetical protein